MSDCRSVFLSNVETALITRFGPDEIETISNAIIKALDGYEITKPERSIVTYDWANEMLLKRYCACLAIEGKSNKTIDQYKRTATHLFRVVRKGFAEMTVYDLRLFLALEKERGVSNRTLENTRANLSAFFQWLLLEDIIQKNPCAAIQPIKYTDKVRLPFSNVEIDRLRFACRTEKERALMEVLLSSGVRVSELATIKITDVDFDRLSIHVKNGKGGKERTVYINNLALAHLQKYLLARKEAGPHLFYNKKGEPLNPGGIRYILNEIARRANVENVHPHRFRRTFATGLANRGMDIQVVKRLLGHSDINTTLQYVYTSDESVHNSYQKYIS